MDEEIWKDIHGFEGRYQVSTMGNVRSVARYVSTGNGGKRRIECQPIKQVAKSSNNHMCVSLANPRGSSVKYSSHPVHSLVAEAFIPNPDEKPMIMHIDGNKGNNNVSNLAWASAEELEKRELDFLGFDERDNRYDPSICDSKSAVIECEEWRAVAGYEGFYLVSNLGRIKTVERLVSLKDGRSRIQKEYIKSQTITDRGYRLVELHKDGDRKTFCVHRLVASAFIPNPGGFSQVDHINANPSDNRVENLRWVDKSENNAHRVRMGRQRKCNAMPIARSLRDDSGQNLEGEIWADIRDFEDVYQISSLGRVKSLPRYVKSSHGVRAVHGRILTTSVNAYGYEQVTLNKNGHKTSLKVHRLVAEAFVPNPGALPFVDHLDADRLNNKASNLSWTTPLGNTRHMIELDRNPNYDITFNKKNPRKNPDTAKEIKVVDDDGVVYDSINDAARKMGCGRVEIYNALTIPNKRCHGKRFKRLRDVMLESQSKPFEISDGFFVGEEP